MQQAHSGWGDYIGLATHTCYHLAIGGLVAYDDYGHARYHILNNDNAIENALVGRNGFRKITTDTWSLLVLTQYWFNSSFNLFANFGGAILETKILQKNVPSARNPTASMETNDRNYKFSTILPEIRLGLSWHFVSWLGLFISYTHIFGINLNNDAVHFQGDGVLSPPSNGPGMNTLSAGINITLGPW